MDGLSDKKINKNNILQFLGGNSISEDDTKSCKTDGRIAVIGLACRFPDADDYRQFWSNLLEGKCSIREIERWDEEDYYSADRNAENMSYSKWGGMLDDIASFDPAFFDITPAEAKKMDPQQRILLEETWHAFENAGYSDRDLSGMKCGVYVGIADSSYGDVLSENNTPADSYQCMGLNNSILASRLSYFLNMKGPAIAVDTACSSSLTAIHLACNALLQGDCEMAAASGVTVYSSPKMYINTSKNNMLSENGKCRPFDKDANGFVPGEGCGVVILKRLGDALRDNDNILAVIDGSCMNQDGKTNGIMSPNVISQCALEKEVYEKFGIPVEKIGYCEAHGTGTKLGDPIEIEALTESFREHTSKVGFCSIGSVKANIGHTVAAAGVAGVIKLICMLQNGVKPPEIGYDECNPYIELDSSPFYINTKSEKWEDRADKKCIVSSFGFSGTNVHLVIEGYSDTVGKCESRKRLYVFSAKSESALKSLLSIYTDWLDGQSEDIAARLAYTLMYGRSHFPYRAAFVCSDLSDLRSSITSFLDGISAGGMCSVQSMTDDDAAQLIDHLYESDFSDGDTEKAYSKYLEGYSGNRERLTVHQRIVCAPGYCFDKSVYWIDSKKDRYKNICVLGERLVKAPVDLSARADVSNAVVAAADNKKPAYCRNITAVGGEFFDHTFESDTMVFNYETDKTATDVGTVVRDLFARIKKVLANNTSGSYRIINVFSSVSADTVPELEALDGLSVTVRNEYPQVSVKNIFVASADTSFISDKLYDDICCGNEKTVYYNSQGERYVYDYYDAVPSAEGYTFPDENGNYIITGGTGGIGSELTAYLTGKLHGNIIILGRKALNEDIEQKLEKIQSDKCKAVYISCDITDEDLLKKCAQDIVNSYGTINGVIHCAGIFRNNFIINKDTDEFDTVLAPKVGGTKLLHRYFRGSGLKFFFVISSVASVIGKTGQSDYTYANRFLDLFVRAKSAENRSCRYASFNYSYWENMGMKLSADDADELIEKYGIYSFKGDEGTFAFESAMKTGSINNYLVKTKDTSVIKDRINALSSSHPTKTVNDEYTLSDAEDIIRRVLSDVTGYDISTFTAGFELDALNPDSVIINSFNSRIEKYFTGLPKTILYEKNTVEEIAEYVIKQKTHIIKPLAVNNVGIEAGSASAPDEKNDRSSKLAIIGISGRFASAESVGELWNAVIDEKSLISGLPTDRWKEHEKQLRLYDEEIYCKSGGFMKDIYGFDTELFHISPREAKLTDPQERKFMEVVFEALQDSGYISKSLSSSKVGVFVGSTTNTFSSYAENSWTSGSFEAAQATPWSISNRISWFYNFHGPSMTIDTACSSGAAAFHTACQSIKSGDCDTAVVGGVNIYTHPYKYAVMCRKQMLSRSGVCSAFGQGADGFVPGEGVSAVIIKRLEDAVRDNDHIYAVIESSAINTAGKSKGFLVPDINQQAEVIEKALSDADLVPDDITYIEAHGTGTQLGDPIEIAALNKVYRRGSRTKLCPVGSVKTNIGHLESASFFASLAKVICMIKERKIAKTLNSADINTNIDMENTPFYFPQSGTEWKADSNGRRIAAISSFGAGGVNVHVIVSEYDDLNNDSTACNREKLWFPVSAVSDKRLMTYLAIIKDWLTESSSSHTGFGDICYSLRRKMPMLDISVGICAHSADEAVRVIDSVISSGSASDGAVYSDGNENEDITAEFEKWRKGGKTSETEIGLKLVELPFYPTDNMIYRPDIAAQFSRRDHTSGHRQRSGSFVYGMDSERSFCDGAINVFEVLEIMGEMVYIYNRSDAAGIRSVRFASPLISANAERYEAEISEHDIRVYIAEKSAKRLFAAAEPCDFDEISDRAENSYIEENELSCGGGVPLSTSVHNAVKEFVRSQVPFATGFAAASVESCLLYGEISASDEKNIHIGLVKKVSDTKYVIDLRISDRYGNTLMIINRMYLICKG